MIHLGQHASLSRLRDHRTDAGGRPLMPSSSTATLWQSRHGDPVRSRVRELSGGLEVVDGEAEILVQGIALTERDAERRLVTVQSPPLLLVLQVNGRLAERDRWEGRVLVCADNDLFCSHADIAVETVGSMLCVTGVSTLLPQVTERLRDSSLRVVESRFAPRARKPYPPDHQAKGLDLTFRLLFGRASA